ncbi:MAG: phosphopyruvate hydratase [Thermoplasmata archaeon]|nr:phosphopyruvate hydratase [Thermoplasmata archaeon]
MSLIEDILIRKILDSRGNPTIEVEVITENGYGTAAAPSGASTGEHEVKAFPEGGVDTSIAIFNAEIGPELIGADSHDQKKIDAFLREVDGTPDLSRMGGNLAVAVSLAVAKAAASTLGIPLYDYIGEFTKSMPNPLGNLIGGGQHAIGGTDIQEFLVISKSDNVADSVFANAYAHKMVGKKLKALLPDTAIGKGDEGAWVAKLTNEKALEILRETCDQVKSDLGIEIHPALDVAASELYRDGKYHYKDKVLDSHGQIDYMIKLTEDFELHILEDPLDENDFESYAELTRAIGDRCLTVGDDLYVTTQSRLEKGIELGSTNAILIKPNQVGTLTDTIQTVKTAMDNGLKTVISHRSGETIDETIAHLGVAFGSYAIKTGAVGGERIAKLNELIRIAEDLEG